MIRYALACEGGHGFEAWFGSSADYDDLAARGLVECPLCASRHVAKQIMAPAVTGTRRAAEPVPSLVSGPSSGPSSGPLSDASSGLTDGARRKIREAMGEVRRHVESNFDYVGDRFAREARDIHEGRSEERGIYGEATPTEVRALKADGVGVAPLPPAPVDPAKLN